MHVPSQSSPCDSPTGQRNAARQGRPESHCECLIEPSEGSSFVVRYVCLRPSLVRPLPCHRLLRWSALTCVKSTDSKSCGLCPPSARHLLSVRYRPHRTNHQLTPSLRHLRLSPVSIVSVPASSSCHVRKSCSRYTLPSSTSSSTSAFSPRLILAPWRTRPPPLACLPPLRPASTPPKPSPPLHGAKRRYAALALLATYHVVMAVA